MDFILEKFDNLDKSKKVEFLKNIMPSALLKIQLMEKEINKNDCQIEGHSFGDWEVSYLTKYDTDNESVKYWKRKCTKCELVDVSSIDPKENEKCKNK